MKCAVKRCGGPGSRKLYRRDLPPSVHRKKCSKHGWLWEIPCCAVHHSTLRKCREPGCGRLSARAGRCHAHRMRLQRASTVPWRHCPDCLHCGKTLSQGNYSASGLCRRCYHLLEDSSAFAAELARLNALAGDDTPSGNLLLLVQHCSVAGAAEALGVKASKVTGWLDTGDVPAELLGALQAHVRGEL